MIRRVSKPHNLLLAPLPTSTFVLFPLLFYPHVGDIHPTELYDLLTQHKIEEHLPYFSFFHERTPLDCPNS